MHNDFAVLEGAGRLRDNLRRPLINVHVGNRIQPRPERKRTRLRVVRNYGIWLSQLGVTRRDTTVAILGGPTGFQPVSTRKPYILQK